MGCGLTVTPQHYGTRGAEETSGGAPAGTTRGFGEAEYREIGKLIVEVLDGLREANSDEGNATVEARVRDKVVALTDRFPIYQD